MINLFKFGNVKAINRFLATDPKDRSPEDIEILRYYTLLSAVENEEIEVVDRLLQQDCIKMGVNPNAQDNAAIKYAFENGYVDIVNRLLQEKATRNWTGAKQILSTNTLINSLLISVIL